MIPFLSISPVNLLEWSNMEDWVNGASSAPTEHILTGSGATIARESSIVKRGTYSAAVTRVGNDATLYNDFPDYDKYLGKTVTFGAWVYASVANRARISINDGVGSSSSSYHTGTAGWEFLTVTRNIDESATKIRCGMEVNTGNTTAYFDGGMLVDGATVFTDISQYVEDWKNGKKFRMTKYQIARRPGLIIPGIEHGEKLVTISGKVCGTSQENCRNLYDALLKAIGDKERDLYLYDDRVNKVFIESEDPQYMAALRVVKFDIKFAMQSPFSHSTQRYRSQQTVSSSPISFTVTSNGTAFTKPRISFVASGNDITSLTVQNLTTGQTWTWNGTVLDGDMLVVDFDNGTILNDGVDAVEYSVGDFPQFRLDPGANLLKFTGSNCVIKADYYERFL